MYYFWDNLTESVYLDYQDCIVYIQYKFTPTGHSKRVFIWYLNMHYLFDLVFVSTRDIHTGTHKQKTPMQNLMTLAH